MSFLVIQQVNKVLFRDSDLDYSTRFFLGTPKFFNQQWMFSLSLITDAIQQGTAQS
jgi:hypothetical protein